MTGERLAWFRVASHLGVSVEELAVKISFREFLNWLEFLNWEDRQQTKADFYLAQIAAEIRRTVVKKPKDVKVKDFFVQIVEKVKKRSLK